MKRFQKPSPMNTINPDPIEINRYIRTSKNQTKIRTDIRLSLNNSPVDVADDNHVKSFSPSLRFDMLTP